MQVHRIDIEGVLQFVLWFSSDERGFFARTFDTKGAAENGIDGARFVQNSRSRSFEGVVRGLHGRGGDGEAELVRCAHGAVYDVVVDARPRSTTFGRVASFVLDDVSVRFDDADLAIRWPRPIGSVGERDRGAGTWADLCRRLGATMPRTTDRSANGQDRRGVPALVSGVWE